MAAVKGLADQRELIVRAARRSIARNGLGALRIRAVAAEVDLSHASVLHYFRSKDELVQAVLDSVIHGDIAQPLVENAPPTDPATELRRLLIGMSTPTTEDGDDHQAVMLELLRHGQSSGVHMALLTYTTTWRDYVADLIWRGQMTGDFRADLDPRGTAGIVIEVSLGLKTNTPLPEGLEQSAIEQLLALLSR